MKVLLVGGGGREHAIAKALVKGGARIFSTMKYRNPGIARLAEAVLQTDEAETDRIASWAADRGVDIAVVGPEMPLALGLVDLLEKRSIPSVGPDRAAAEIEASKKFARDLMAKHRIPGLIEYNSFSRAQDLERFLKSVDYDLVVKPVGLTGGKGVKVMGDHFGTREDALRYAKQVLKDGIGGGRSVLIERKEVGEEFSVQAFCDGKTLAPMPAVQDYKRALEGDRGPNTGGMGSVSQEDGLLPFLPRSDYEKSVKIMQRVVEAMASEGRPFKGILYGGFILTRTGPKVIEFNARFADPESMNVLSLLKDDLLSIFSTIAHGGLKSSVAFSRRATVCKYAVPEGYGTAPVSGAPLLVNEDAIRKEGAELFYAAVDSIGTGLFTTSSRSLAIVGVAEDITKAFTIAEDGLRHVKGRVYVRHDIGHPDQVRKKVARMRELRRGRAQ